MAGIIEELKQRGLQRIKDARAVYIDAEVQGRVTLNADERDRFEKLRNEAEQIAELIGGR